MGNPLCGGYNIRDVIRIFKQAKQNPSIVGDLLVQNGRIDQSQLQAMNGMTPEQMGQYMSSNGIMSNRFLQNGSQFANPVKHSLNDKIN